jgi:hypothetical protein
MINGTHDQIGAVMLARTKRTMAAARLVMMERRENFIVGGCGFT